MRHLIAFILFNLPIVVNAQCDSVAVRQWLRSMNPDTVCFAPFGVWECPDTCFPSCMRSFPFDSTTFSYKYRDPVSGLRSVRSYYHGCLDQLDYNTPGDTNISIIYNRGRCDTFLYLVTKVNDSLTRLNKKGHVYYEYYSETAYDTNGVITVSWIETIVYKRGKKYRRTVYYRPKRWLNKEKIRMKRV